MKKEYKNDEITVIWRPETCIHSEKCFHGLSSVFNPKNRPWVNLDGADNKAIIDQVAMCPSGALAGHYNDSPAAASTPPVVTSVEVMRNGPLIVKGNLEVKHKGKVEQKESKVTAFCRCGASSNKPYCDGSHNKINFEG